MSKNTIKNVAIVLPPESTDLDGYACAVGYAELLCTQGIAALPWYSGPMDAETKYVNSRISPTQTASNEQCYMSQQYIYVDGSNLQLLPDCVDPHLVSEVIDHHFPHDAKRDYPNAITDVQAVGAAATLIVERFQLNSIIPSNHAAVLLYCAIHSNTQRLNGSITTQRDIDAEVWLTSNANIPTGIVELQFKARRDDILSDLPASVSRESKKYFDHSSKEYVVAQLEMPGAMSVLNDQIEQLVNHTAKLSKQAILNMVDVSTNESAMLVPDAGFRLRIERLFNVKFDGLYVTSSPIQIRKQIVSIMAKGNDAQ